MTGETQTGYVRRERRERDDIQELVFLYTDFVTEFKIYEVYRLSKNVNSGGFFGTMEM